MADARERRFGRLASLLVSLGLHTVVIVVAAPRSVRAPGPKAEVVRLTAALPDTVTSRPSDGPSSTADEASPTSDDATTEPTAEPLDAAETPPTQPAAATADPVDPRGSQLPAPVSMDDAAERSANDQPEPPPSPPPERAAEAVTQPAPEPTPKPDPEPTKHPEPRAVVPRPEPEPEPTARKVARTEEHEAGEAPLDAEWESAHDRRAEHAERPEVTASVAGARTEAELSLPVLGAPSQREGVPLDMSTETMAAESPADRPLETEPRPDSTIEGRARSRLEGKEQEEQRVTPTPMPAELPAPGAPTSGRGGASLPTATTRAAPETGIGAGGEGSAPTRPDASGGARAGGAGGGARQPAAQGEQAVAAPGRPSVGERELTVLETPEWWRPMVSRILPASEASQTSTRARQETSTAPDRGPARDAAEAEDQVAEEVDRELDEAREPVQTDSRQEVSDEEESTAAASVTDEPTEEDEADEGAPEREAEERSDEQGAVAAADASPLVEDPQGSGDELPSRGGPSADRQRTDEIRATSPQLVLDEAQQVERPDVATRATPLGRYVQEVDRLLQESWTARDLDPHSKALGIAGDVALRIRVAANGRVEDVEVVRSSGHEALDELALDAVPRRLPRFPADLTQPTIVHDVTFRYRNPLSW